MLNIPQRPPPSIGAVLREHLAPAAEARAAGDHALAVALELDAARALRAAAIAAMEARA